MAEMVVDMVKSMRETLITNAQKLVTLGRWNKTDVDLLVDRIPTEKEASFGADSGVFAALGLIPENHVDFVTNLYTGRSNNEETVGRIKEDYRQITNQEGVENGTLYWLLASSQVRDGEVNQTDFIAQVSNFSLITEAYGSGVSKEVRKAQTVALDQYNQIATSFSLYGNVPIGTNSEAIMGAYLAGHPYGAYMSQSQGLFFIGTYKDTLGLENFEFNTGTQTVNGKDVRTSGPVSEGNYQLVKCSDIHEFSRAISTVQRTLL